MTSDFLREIAGPAGPHEALLDLPEGEPRAVAVLGHPHPLHGGRVATPVDLDAAAVWVWSEPCGFASGQVLAVDGGWSVSEGQY